MLIETTWINETKGWNCGSSGIYDTWCETIGELFLEMQKEYGKCISKVYIGNKNPVAIGWVFQKRERYADCDETYLQSTWVTIHNAQPKKTIEYNYYDLDS